MNILLLDALAPEAQAWLESRHRVMFKPELALDLVVLRKYAYKTEAILFPKETLVTRELLDFLPRLKVIARVDSSNDHTDTATCKERDIKLVNSGSASVRSGAEFLLAGLMMLYRPSLVSAFGAARPPSGEGRELHGSTVGILGLSPTALTLAGMLTGLGIRLVGFDPAVHHTSPVWERLGIQPVALPELMNRSDAVSVQMLDAGRFRGLFDDRLLARGKRGQLWVSVSGSNLFDADALASALLDGRIEACLLDGVEPDFAPPGSALAECDNLIVTPSLAAHTREARLRASWNVVHRLHDSVAPRHSGVDATLSVPMPLGLSGDSAPPSDWIDPDLSTR